eukprot:jgi/Botrbrau1/785/Bobra.0181s0039.1
MAAVNAFETLSEAASTLQGASPEERERALQEALSCPCVEDLVNGPCGPAFKAAFICWVNSDGPEKGYDCLDHFLAMQHCMGRHPEAFADFVGSRKESDEKEDELEAVLAAAGDAGTAQESPSTHILPQMESKGIQSPNLRNPQQTRVENVGGKAG